MPAVPNFVYSSVIQASAGRVFSFHESPDALERLLPPGGRVRVVSREGGLEKGARVVLEMRFGPLRKRWVARHTEYVPNTLFADVQESGPFRRWFHRHEFAAEGPNACRLTDRVEFSLPGGPLMDWLAGWAVKLALRAMFRARHAATRRAVT